MASEIVYAIIDLESNWFVTKDKLPKLDELGMNTRLFDRKYDAMRFLTQPINFDLGINKPTMLQNNLAWWLLEKVYNKDRWHINCSKQEFKDAIINVSKLRIVPINMEYNPYVY